MIRIAMIVASALGGGYAASQRALNREIEKRRDDAVTEAVEQARQQLTTLTQAHMQSALRRMAISLAVRASLLGMVLAGYRFGGLPSTWLAIALGIGLLVCGVSDLYRAWPTLRLATRLTRDHNWKPAQAFRAFVAARVFDDTYAQAQARTQEGRNPLWLRLSGRKPETLSRDIAASAANLAAEASVETVRPLLLAAALRAAGLLCLYAIAITAILLAI